MPDQKNNQLAGRYQILQHASDGLTNSYLCYDEKDRQVCWLNATNTTGDNLQPTPESEKARVLFHGNFFIGAEEILKKILQNSARNTDAHVALGFLFERQEEFSEAVYHLTRALEQNPDQVAALVLRAWLLNQLKKTSRSRQDLDKALLLKPRDMYVRCFSARIESTGPNPEQAIYNIQQVCEDFPKEAYTHFIAGWILHQNKKPVEAAQAFIRAITTNPHLAIAFHELGIVTQEMGNAQIAIECYNATLELAPNWALAYYNRGCFFEQNDYAEEAIADYTEACLFNKADASPPFNRGNIYLKQGKIGAALESFLESVKRNPYHANAQLNLGNVYKQQGQNKKAINQFKQVLEIDPTHLMALNNLAGCYVDINDHEEALRIFGEAIRHHPENTQIQMSRIIILKDLGKEKEMEAALIELQQTNPGFLEKLLGK